MTDEQHSNGDDTGGDDDTSGEELPEFEILEPAERSRTQRRVEQALVFIASALVRAIPPRFRKTARRRLLAIVAALAALVGALELAADVEDLVGIDIPGVGPEPTVPIADLLTTTVPELPEAGGSDE
jgi:hypothetical protein